MSIVVFSLIESTFIYVLHKLFPTESLAKSLAETLSETFDETIDIHKKN